MKEFVELSFGKIIWGFVLENETLDPIVPIEVADNLGLIYPFPGSCSAIPKEIIEEADPPEIIEYPEPEDIIDWLEDDFIGAMSILLIIDCWDLLDIIDWFDELILRSLTDSVMEFLLGISYSDADIESKSLSVLQIFLEPKYNYNFILSIHL